jgi:hypothetical protein
MNFRLLAIIGLLATVSVVDPIRTQDTESIKSGTSTAQAQENGDRVLQACAQDQADTLPNPFSDVSATHWAYKAVLSMYYCGAYRGSVLRDRVKPLSQPQSAQPSSSQPSSEWTFLEPTK